MLQNLGLYCTHSKTRYDMQPMAFWFNGEVIFARMEGEPRQMCLYDSHTNQIKDFLINITYDLYCSSFFYYKDSLAPLTGDNLCSNEFCNQPTLLKDPLLISSLVSFVICIYLSYFALLCTE